MGSEELIRHPERDVRLWAAKCTAEALRIYAPKQPFGDAAHLRQIMVVILEQIGILREPRDVLFPHALDLLELVAECNALMLIFECKDQDELISTLVTRCIGAAHASRHSSEDRLQASLIKVLGTVLNEVEDIPKSALVALVEELTPQARSSRGRMLACRVLAGLATGSAVLSINDFLNASLYNHPDSEAGQLLQAWEAEEQRDALLAITSELFSIDPSLMSRVLPNLQMDLQTEDVGRRKRVTKCVGEMLGHGSSREGCPEAPRLPLVCTHPLLLDKFLDRLDDADEGVRAAAIDGAGGILATAFALGDKGPGKAGFMEAANRIRDALKLRCLDPSEAIRIRVVQVAAESSQSVPGLKCLESVLPEIFRRILDKKPRVRETCIEASAHLYAMHALPAWIECREEAAMRLSFIPQLFFEAYSVFAGARIGHTVYLEKCIEKHFLGLGLGAMQRGLALAGLLTSVTKAPAGEKGFYKLLDLKREGHAALRRFVLLRLAKEGPILTNNAIAATMQSSESQLALESQASGEVGKAMLAVQSMVRVSPLMEDKTVYNDHAGDFKHLDLVRDRALWLTLDHLTDPVHAVKTSEIGQQMSDLKQLIGRAKNVHPTMENIRPLLRRCFLTSWLLPDQVSGLMTVWRASSTEEDATAKMASVAQKAVAELPRYFPGAFTSHVAEIATHLSDVQGDSVYAALRALSAIGKRRYDCCLNSGAGPEPLHDHKAFAEKLLEAVEGLCSEEADTYRQVSVCRKAVKALGIFLPEGNWIAFELFLDWAEDVFKKRRVSSFPIALNLIAACRDWVLHMPDCPSHVRERCCGQDWFVKAGTVFRDGPSTDVMMQCAAVSFFAAASAERELIGLLNAGDGAHSPAGALLSYASVATLRAIRRGSLRLTTGLLKSVTIQACIALAPERGIEEVEPLLGELQQLQKPCSGNSLAPPLALAARLRICATLPTLFAKAATKRHRDAAQRTLSASLAKAVRQSVEKKQPLLDFAVACFIHFLARVPAFVEEASKPVSPYTESSCISNFFAEALFRIDPLQSAEFGSTVLRVTERVSHFVDREDPRSDNVHKAAYVLKYVMEKRLGRADRQLQPVQGRWIPAKESTKSSFEIQGTTITWLESRLTEEVELLKNGFRRDGYTYTLGEDGRITAADDAWKRPTQGGMSGSLPAELFAVPVATAGVDLNNDGRADIMVTGADMNLDGIPDALQRGQARGTQVSQQPPTSAIRQETSVLQTSPPPPANTGVALATGAATGAGNAQTGMTEAAEPEIDAHDIPVAPQSGEALPPAISGASSPSIPAGQVEEATASVSAAVDTQMGSSADPGTAVSSPPFDFGEDGTSPRSDLAPRRLSFQSAAVNNVRSSLHGRSSSSSGKRDSLWAQVDGDNSDEKAKRSRTSPQ
jgi:hypothetical protein